MTEIKKGDQVRHKNILMNGGVPMNVIDVKSEQALCDYFEGSDMIHKQNWIDLSQLDKVVYGNGSTPNNED